MSKLSSQFSQQSPKLGPKQGPQNAIALSLFASRISAVCEEMGALLQRASFSPNIRDRLDFSCAVFDAQGRLSAQAAHIPVHLGSMAYAMAGIVADIAWAPGDMVVLNNPFKGGTHLPDVTLIAPVFAQVSADNSSSESPNKELVAFVTNRAHHADIGADSPGSMPLSTFLEEEGLIIDPAYLLRGGEINQPLFDELMTVMRNPHISRGDFSAQIGANRLGVERLGTLINTQGAQEFLHWLSAYNDYAREVAASALIEIPDGEYQFTDLMDDDGQGNQDLAIVCKITIRKGQVHVDFAGSAAQATGNINCPESVTAAAVYYAFRCLMPEALPGCAGAFEDIELAVPKGSFLNAAAPAAVAAGNVETSMRVVDVVLGALAQAVPQRICAAAHGGMNNLAMGWHGNTDERTSDKEVSDEGLKHNTAWDYYETMGGGLGAGPLAPGLHARQAHMTNTLNTPIEVMESVYPLRVTRYSIRTGTGGQGTHPGGDGIAREIQFLGPARVTLLTERRRHAPWGLSGGGPGAVGENQLNGQILAAKCSVTVTVGDVLCLHSPGGGGWGKT